MGITKFIARRLAFGVLTLLIVSIVVFALTQTLGDPVEAILGRDALPDAVTARACRARPRSSGDHPVLGLADRSPDG